jgi:DNA mismatch endonuclease (patch repair protein)
MTDIVDAQTRSRMMGGIRGKDTQPELRLRRALHALGFRYRLHVKGLPGRPDMVFPKYRAVVFVHGCFWHGHECPVFRWPKTRPEFWRAKIEGNRARDARQIQALMDDGWRVAVVWECDLRQPATTDRLAREIAGWLKSTDTPSFGVFQNRPPRE